MSVSIWSGLLDDFKALRDLQGGDDLRSVLIEFSDPELISRGESVIPSKNYPKEWAMTQAIIEEKSVIDSRPERQRVYKQLVIPYRDRHQILMNGENGPPLPERLQTIKKRLVESLELAGKELLNHSGTCVLPDEIAGLNSNISAWLLFLHFIGKPERKTWERVNQCLLFGYVMGVVKREDIKTIAPEYGPPNVDLPHTVGQFSFEPLTEDSYSEIADITAASIEAIRRIEKGLLYPDQEEKSSKTDQELKLLSNANEWVNECLGCISWISTKLEWLSEQFTDIDKVYLGVEHPARIPKDVTIPAAKILRVFFDCDMDRYDQLLMLSYEYGRVSKIEESLQVANANGSPSIEFRGHPYITAIELVNSLNGLFLYRLNDIRLNAEGWLVADHRNEITEDWLRQDIESILTVYESVKDIDHKLITLIKSRLTLEQAACKRWIYDRYGFPESTEKIHQQPPYSIPPAINDGQGQQVAADIANQIEGEGEKKQEKQKWYRSPFDDVPNSHRDKNGDPIGGFRGTQQQLIYALEEDRKTFISRALRGAIFVHMHKTGDYEMFIHRTEIGRLDKIRDRFNEFPTLKPQSSSKKKRDKGSKKD
ncbi:hypothetical protein Mal35_46380 [Gimesia maris]|uniref:hypothetical protein n=1 Tax=Gimesia maris TaxID=122 RepID=UPI00118BD9CB|nr:hypothetical protein [Gimesia maris]QDT81159.1 hypothetical protein Mal35_46380 [Gimesia maris]